MKARNATKFWWILATILFFLTAALSHAQDWFSKPRDLLPLYGQPSFSSNNSIIYESSSFLTEFQYKDGVLIRIIITTTAGNGWQLHDIFLKEYGGPPMITFEMGFYKTTYFGEVSNAVVFDLPMGNAHAIIQRKEGGVL